MNLTVQFESAENRFRQVLEDFFVSHYDEKSLGSHGLEHHRQVWKNASTITLSLAEKGKQFDDNFAGRLMLVCFMHDIGMMDDPGPKHGKQSRLMCEKFFTIHNLNPAMFPGVLDTIENHDNKDYKQNSNPGDLLRILSVADDLDAFGYTGIYRYAEIYLKRGLAPKQLGTLISENASMRFNNFVNEFNESKELVKFHENRFRILLDFFSIYTTQSEKYEFNGVQPQGYCGVIELFMLMINNKMELKEIIKFAKENVTDTVIRKFIYDLENDMLR